MINSCIFQLFIKSGGDLSPENRTRRWGKSGKSDSAAVETDAQIANRPYLFFYQPGSFG
jgi:hypothetical protein